MGDVSEYPLAYFLEDDSKTAISAEKLKVLRLNRSFSFFFELLVRNLEFLHGRLMRRTMRKKESWRGFERREVTRITIL